MIIKNIHTTLQSDAKFIKMRNKYTHKQLKLIDISNEVFLLGDKLLQVNGHQYNLYEYYLISPEGVNKILLTDNGILVVEYGDNKVAFIYPLSESLQDTNITNSHFITKGDKTMSVEKVVGTSFRFKEYGDKHYTQFAGTDLAGKSVPTRVGKAILMPEPTNPYDSGAVMVIAQMVDGTSFPLGYLAKGSELQSKIKSPTLAKLVIVAYSEGGDMNDSFTVEVTE